jgi:hypothetical protein
MHSDYLFKCTVFHTTTTARKVGLNMVVSQEWPLQFRSYEQFLGMLRACAASGNDDALLLLGLVKTLFFLSLTLLFTLCLDLVVG